jgi:DNA repair protein RecO (recombination protein O)
MPLYRDEAVVLRTHKLGEADRIITFLTRYHGQVRAVAKGVRRTSSKFGARLEPFMLVDVQFFEGRTLDIVNQVETIAAYGGEISADYRNFTVATVLVETAEKLTGDDSSPQQHILLVGALKALATGEHDAELILNSYLLRALAISGWAPNFFDCVLCETAGPHEAFVVQLGGVVCRECRPAGAAVISSQATELLGALLGGEWSVIDASEPATRAAASGVIAAYSQYHIERGLKSLKHLDRV